MVAQALSMRKEPDANLHPLLMKKDQVPIVQEAWWTPGPVWTGAENLAPTGVRSPDREARSQSLYRLSYRDHPTKVVTINNDTNISDFHL